MTQEEANNLHAVARDPNFRPMRVDSSDPDQPVEIVDTQHEVVRRVRLNHGEEVANELLR